MNKGRKGYLTRSMERIPKRPNSPNTVGVKNHLVVGSAKKRQYVSIKKAKQVFIIQNFRKSPFAKSFMTQNAKTFRKNMGQYRHIVNASVQANATSLWETTYPPQSFLYKTTVRPQTAIKKKTKRSNSRSSISRTPVKTTNRMNLGVRGKSLVKFRRTSKIDELTKNLKNISIHSKTAYKQRKQQKMSQKKYLRTCSQDTLARVESSETHQNAFTRDGKEANKEESKEEMLMQLMSNDLSNVSTKQTSNNIPTHPPDFYKLQSGEKVQIQLPEELKAHFKSITIQMKEKEIACVDFERNPNAPKRQDTNKTSKTVKTNQTVNKTIEEPQDTEKIKSKQALKEEKEVEDLIYLALCKQVEGTTISNFPTTLKKYIEDSLKKFGRGNNVAVVKDLVETLGFKEADNKGKIEEYLKRKVEYTVGRLKYAESKRQKTENPEEEAKGRNSQHVNFPSEYGKEEKGNAGPQTPKSRPKTDHLEVPGTKPRKLRTFLSKNWYVEIEGEQTEAKKALMKKFTEKIQEHASKSNSSSDVKSGDSKEKWKKTIKEVMKQNMFKRIVDIFVDRDVRDGFFVSPDKIGCISINDQNVEELQNLPSDELFVPVKNKHIKEKKLEELLANDMFNADQHHMHE